MNVDFVCQKHYDWSKKSTLRSVVNIFFSKELKNFKGFARKSKIKQFKKRQRKKK